MCGGLPCGEVIADELGDTADGVLKTVSSPEMIGGEDAHHDAFRVALQHTDVVADVWQEIAGLVRDAIAGYVSRESRTVDLASHDLKHLSAGFFTDGLAFFDLLEELPHIAGGA